jgi:hypothetical protein
MAEPQPDYVDGPTIEDPITSHRQVWRFQRMPDGVAMVLLQVASPPAAAGLRAGRIPPGQIARPLLMLGHQAGANKFILQTWFFRPLEAPVQPSLTIGFGQGAFVAPVQVATQRDVRFLHTEHLLHEEIRKQVLQADRVTLIFDRHRRTVPMPSAEFRQAFMDNRLPEKVISADLN